MMDSFSHPALAQGLARIEALAQGGGEATATPSET